MKIEVTEFRDLIEMSTRYKCDYLTHGRALTYPMLHFLEALAARGLLDWPPGRVNLAKILEGRESVRAVSSAIDSTERVASQHFDAAATAARDVSVSLMQDALSDICAAARALDRLNTASLSLA